MTNEDMLRARVAELEKTLSEVQYRREPFEDPSHYAERRPWHSPHCYEKSGSHRDHRLCTCGLTDMRAKVFDVEKTIAAEVAKVDASWRQRVQLRANIMDGPNGPECWCGEPSSYQSGECAHHGGAQLREYETRKKLADDLRSLSETWIRQEFGTEAATTYRAVLGGPPRPSLRWCDICSKNVITDGNGDCRESPLCGGTYDARPSRSR